jgi:hypothetical protein
VTWRLSTIGVTSHCGVDACCVPRMFWPFLLYRMLALDAALLSSMLFCCPLPVRPVVRFALPLYLGTCVLILPLWRAVWLGFRQLPVRSAYVVGRALRLNCAN